MGEAIIDSLLTMLPEIGQQRQKCLGHAVGANRLTARCCSRTTVAQVVVERDAGVVDEDVDERPALR